MEEEEGGVPASVVAGDLCWTWRLGLVVESVAALCPVQ